MYYAPASVLLLLAWGNSSKVGVKMHVSFLLVMSDLLNEGNMNEV